PTPYRIDRHPSMSRHPTTPMTEADLRRHIGQQTLRPIGLLDLLKLRDGYAAPPGFDAFVVDTLEERDLDLVGAILDAPARDGGSRFVVGTSSVGTALAGRWHLTRPPLPTASPASGPILVVAGSCSPVTAGQIRHAAKSGFHVAAVQPGR